MPYSLISQSQQNCKMVSVNCTLFVVWRLGKPIDLPFCESLRHLRTKSKFCYCFEHVSAADSALRCRCETNTLLHYIYLTVSSILLLHIWIRMFAFGAFVSWLCLLLFGRTSHLEQFLYFIFNGPYNVYRRHVTFMPTGAHPTVLRRQYLSANTYVVCIVWAFNGESSCNVFFPLDVIQWCDEANVAQDVLNSS